MSNYLFEFVTVFSGVGIIITALIYRDMRRAYDKIDYLELREMLEIEKAFLAGVEWQEKESDQEYEALKFDMTGYMNANTQYANEIQRLRTKFTVL